MQQTKKIISIYTDRLHYYQKTREGYATNDLNQYFTFTWRSWFEKKILRMDKKSMYTKQSNIKNKAIYGSLRSCYRRTLRKLDSDSYSKTRITRLDELFRVFENELKVEVEKAKARGVDEGLIRVLKEEFIKIERQAQSWNARFVRKLSL